MEVLQLLQRAPPLTASLQQPAKLPSSTQSDLPHVSSADLLKLLQGTSSKRQQETVHNSVEPAASPKSSQTLSLSPRVQRGDTNSASQLHSQQTAQSTQTASSTKPQPHSASPFMPFVKMIVLQQHKENQVNKLTKDQLHKHLIEALSVKHCACRVATSLMISRTRSITNDIT
jgi:hypothetical protein